MYSMICSIKKNLISSYNDLIIFLLVLGCLTFPDVDTICLGMQFIAILLTFLNVLRDKVFSRYVLTYILWLIAFSTLCFASSIWAQNYNKTVLSTTISFVQFGCISMCILVYCSNIKRIHNVIKYVIVSSMFLCTRFILTVPFADWGLLRTLEQNSIFLSNETAMVMAFAALFLYWYSFINYDTRNHNKTLSIISILIMMLVVVLMGTKKGLVIFGLGSIIMYLLSSEKLVSILKKIIVVSCVFALSIYSMLNVEILYNVMGSRLEMMINGLMGLDTDGSTRTRMLFIYNALDIFREHYLIGIGQDGFRYENFHQFTYSHNNYTEILANLGLVGFVTYYYIVLSTLNKSIHCIKNTVLPFVLVVIMLITDFGAVSYSSETKALWLALAISTSNILSERKDGSL